MSKSLLITMCATVMLTGWSHAQTLPTQPPPPQTTKDILPPGPLIVRQMPDFSQWTIDYTYSNTPKPGEASFLDQYKKEALTDPALAKSMENPQYVFTIQNIRPIHTLVTKTKDVMHEERTFEQDYKGEMWCNNQIKVEKRPNLSALVAVINIDAGGSPFPDFDWISKKTFIGFQPHGDAKCIAFRQDRYNDQRLYIGTAYAYVDVTTHYPVAFQYQFESREYKFLPPPTVQLTIPDDYLASATQMLTQIQKATPHLAPP